MLSVSANEADHFSRAFEKCNEYFFSSGRRDGRQESEGALASPPSKFELSAAALRATTLASRSFCVRPSTFTSAPSLPPTFPPSVSSSKMAEYDLTQVRPRRHFSMLVVQDLSRGADRVLHPLSSCSFAWPSWFPPSSADDPIPGSAPCPSSSRSPHRPRAVSPGL